MSLDIIKETSHSWEFLHLTEDWTCCGSHTLSFLNNCEISLWLRTAFIKGNLCLQAKMKKTTTTMVTAIISIRHPSYPEKETTAHWSDSCELPSLKWPLNSQHCENKYKFECDITWFLETPYFSPGPLGLGGAVARYYMNPILSDITIVIGEKKIPAHKVVLSSCSPVLESIIKTSTNNSQNVILVEDMSFDAMKKLLEFMYNGHLSSKTRVSVELLAVAENYKIPALKDHCECLLSEQLEVENVFQVYEAAEKHRMPKLKQHCVNFIYLNRKNLVDLPMFDQFWSDKHELMRDLLKKLLRE